MGAKSFPCLAEVTAFQVSLGQGDMGSVCAFFDRYGRGKSFGQPCLKASRQCFQVSTCFQTLKKHPPIEASDAADRQLERSPARSRQAELFEQLGLLRLRQPERRHEGDMRRGSQRDLTTVITLQRPLHPLGHCGMLLREKDCDEVQAARHGDEVGTMRGGWCGNTWKLSACTSRSYAGRLQGIKKGRGFHPAFSQLLAFCLVTPRGVEPLTF